MQSPRGHLLGSTKNGDLSRDSLEAVWNEVQSGDPPKTVPRSLILTQLEELAAAFKQPCNGSGAEIFQLLPWAIGSEEIKNGMWHRAWAWQEFMKYLA
jgi:hypothetical protein